MKFSPLSAWLIGCALILSLAVTAQTDKKSTQKAAETVKSSAAAEAGKDKPAGSDVEKSKPAGKEKGEAAEKAGQVKEKEKSTDKSIGKEKPKEDSLYNSGLVGGLKFRSIGPAFCSGRIADFAVNPRNHSEWFVAAASGHLWKTVNNGTTFEPVFDNNGA